MQESTFTNYDPVSYTHLDVYKRQEIQSELAFAFSELLTTLSIIIPMEVGSNVQMKSEPVAETV